MNRTSGFLCRAAVAGALVLSATASVAADAAKGREKADQVCAACHGKDGNTPIDPSYPKLAGQSADYLYQALLGYRNETRKNAIMGGMAKPLTKVEMRDLAAFYASLRGQLSYRK